jgi:thiosulfate/3-mercaptopyruvate sulfurtransferase
MAMSDYARPDVLVSTDWVDQHKFDPNVVVVEVDVDTKAYEEGHVPGALAWNWQTQLCDTLRRDVISKADLEKLLGESGISNNTTVILYGDNNNWFAAWALWQMKMYGHNDVRIMNGGRKKWLEEDRSISKDIPNFSKGNFTPSDPNPAIRSFLNQVRESLSSNQTKRIDVRSPPEFSGEITAPPEYPTEHAQRGGHIPGAVNIPWAKAVNEDGTFKSADELATLYQTVGITQDKEIITYCRIGERSSHTWFVLKHLLGYPNVKNYDGSWTEWGNMIDNPIEK